MVKNVAAKGLVAIIAFGLFPLAFAEKTTELYIPVGKSPGLSAKINVIGRIDAVNSRNQTLTVRSASGTYTVQTTKYTLIFLDHSKLRQPSIYGDFSDFKKGMMVEVRFESDKRHRPAEWIKLQMGQ
jgi:hypothetical protein